MKVIKLKGGREAVLREAVKDDASAMLNYITGANFEIEGMTTREFMIKDEFFDSYHMGLKLD